MGLGKLLMVAGAVLFLAGLGISTFGRLPGDLEYRRGNFTFYFPLVTSLLLSALLTLAMWFLGRNR
ncbi:MAG: DUF2905 domain-containing protein [Bryobacteraceae bacterium]|nr:DUF2905 domain-containing protein [Bryobacteraceae bacterium]